MRQCALQVATGACCGFHHVHALLVANIIRQSAQLDNIHMPSLGWSIFPSWCAKDTLFCESMPDDACLLGLQALQHLLQPLRPSLQQVLQTAAAQNTQELCQSSTACKAALRALARLRALLGHSTTWLGQGGASGKQDKCMSPGHLVVQVGTSQQLPRTGPSQQLHCAPNQAACMPALLSPDCLLVREQEAQCDGRIQMRFMWAACGSPHHCCAKLAFCDGFCPPRSSAT